MKDLATPEPSPGSSLKMTFRRRQERIGDIEVEAEVKPVEIDCEPVEFAASERRRRSE